MYNDKKKRAFEKSVNDTAQCLFEYHRENMNKADDPAGYIQDEIKYINQTLDKSLHKLFLIRTGTYNYSGFTDSLCDEILSTTKPKKWNILYPVLENGTVKERRDNKDFLLAVDLRLKEMFKSLLKSIRTDINIDSSLLKKMVKRANELHENDWDAYKPFRGNPIISTYVKNELSEEFGKGVSTIHEWFNDYCEKIDSKTIRIKPEVIASLKSE